MNADQIASILCCPRCHADLAASADSYTCPSCKSTYPVIAGIADFRVYPDPYIDIEADRAKGQRLAAAAERLHLDFAGLVDYYYSITPEVPPDLAQRYAAHHREGRVRGQAMLERLAHYDLALKPGARVLDVGCGTGGFVAAASSGGAQVIGVDYAFRWLVIGRQQLRELGCDSAQLICACADYLPFRAASFDLITAESTLEHIEQTQRALAEFARVRAAGSGFMARTVNRLSIAPEPHVGVWGVGFLPRRWQDRYVRWRKGIAYEHIRLYSYFEWRRLLRVSGASDLTIRSPYMTEDDYQHHPPQRQRLFRLYQRLGDVIPPLRPLLTLFGPYLDLTSKRR